MSMQEVESNWRSSSLFEISYAKHLQSSPIEVELVAAMKRARHASERAVQMIT